MRSNDRDRVQMLGARIAELREARGWSQTELGRRLHGAGMTAAAHQTTVCRTEKGERAVSVFEAIEMAGVFGISLDELVGREPIQQDASAGLREAIAVLQNELARRNN